MNLMNAFKKKDENDVPDVSSMINSGMSQQDIIGSIMCILTVDRWGRKAVTILGFATS